MVEFKVTISVASVASWRMIGAEVGELAVITRQGIIIRSLAATFVLYFSYFCIGVVLDIVGYASVGLRKNDQIDMIWKVGSDVFQILSAAYVMKMFVKVYNAGFVVAFFGILLSATVAQIYLFTPELAAVSRLSGVGQALTATSICVLLLWKGRL